MHYKNGSEAREGDPVICRPDKSSSYTVAGKLHSINTQSTTCNGRLAVPVPGGVEQMYVTLSDCYHAADAFGAIEKLITEVVAS